jgi:hypothetical protein
VSDQSNRQSDARDDGSKSASEQKPLRQAVVLIHGMGEQVPMETLRDFAEAVWEKDTSLHESPESAKSGELFYVPDPNSGSRELRRISTRKSRPRGTDGRHVRTDFFELYWADSTNDTTWRDFLLWYARLVLRSPGDVPKEVRWIWVLLWIFNITLVVAIEIAVLSLVPSLEKGEGAILPTVKILVLAGAAAGIGWVLGRLDLSFPPGWACKWLAAAAGFIVLWCIVVLVALIADPYVAAFRKTYPVFIPGLLVLTAAVLSLLQAFLIRFFGDVARYTIPSPGNISVRQKVRDRGLDLLKQLSACGRYKRVVLVAHSLGTIIAYDLVCLLWADYVSSINKKAEDVPAAEQNSELAKAIEAVTKAATAESFDIGAFRQTQRKFFRVLQDEDRKRPEATFDPDRPIVRWLISDLVTIACPLTHAAFLLARTEPVLKGRFDRRELSKCPPQPEIDSEDPKQAPRLTYQKNWDPDRQRFLHDGVFTGVRWTNIHDAPASPMLFLRGDFIAGPVAKLFGDGVADVNVQPTWPPGGLPPRLFTHTIYWNMQQATNTNGKPTPVSVEVVRDAINLLDEDDTEAKLIARVPKVVA